ncbi:bifunctional glycosyltransferase family 2 protein/CDP-glycerol:glycerophosphate glycerophosphotransferase [Nocardioidaceae bacterium SCSIO 66511]|nr:bifunctional glycosyltransferase family 2 protein/CDP-glycerol:glycerophosphate glycerophosphotransferase [Nocardioidaceae bacterium SCSIO 66511]
MAQWMPHPLRRRLTVALHQSSFGNRVGRDAPFVSVVVAATATHAPYLGECLDSIRDQTRTELEVIVVPYDGGDECAEIAASYGADDWRFGVARPVSGHGAALNAGVARAKGEFITFVGAADTIPPDAFERLVGSLERTGSDLAVGNLHDAAPEKHLIRSEHARAHQRDQSGVVFADAPDALADTYLGNRVFRRRFWRGADLKFSESPSAPVSLPVARAYVLAERFDLLAHVTYHRTRRGDGVPFGYLVPAAPGLREWRTAERRTREELDRPDMQRSLDAWLYAVLDIGIRPYLADVERLDKQEWAVLRDTAAEVVAGASADVWQRVRPEARVAAWLAAGGLRTHLEKFTAQRWFENGQHPSCVRDGVVYAKLPYLDDDELDVPLDCFAVTEREVRPVVSVQRLNWTPDVLRLDLYAYIRFVELAEATLDVEVALVRGDDRLPLDVQVYADPVVTRHAAQPYQNYDHGSVTATLGLDALMNAPRGAWSLEVSVSADGVARTSRATELSWQGSASAMRSYSGPAVAAAPRWDAAAGLVVETSDPEAPVSAPAAGFEIDEVLLDGTTIELHGTYPADRPSTIALEGGGGRFEATLTDDGDRRVSARFELTVDEWSLGARAAKVGAYHVRCRRGDAAMRSRFADALLDALPRDEVGTTYRMRVRRSPHGTPVIELGVPLTPDEQGPYAQRRLQRAYAREHPIDERSVYLQAYAGQSATDSPLAIHEALRQKRPDLKLYWGIADHSQWVPDGGTPLLMRSSEWYDALATAKYVVSNIDFERWFVRHSGQQVLQTYHGVPSKTMGIGLWREKRFTPLRIEQQLARTSDLWDALLTPTPEVNRYYREAFRYQGTILDHGYPRDDVLVSSQAGPIRDTVRARLGIADGQTVVLYAPTWRDDVATGYRSAPFVRHLDVGAVTRQLGDEYVVLVRGHRFNAPTAGDGGNVIDVTSYPEINDLILASDVAVLDYSSLRFDYAVTRKPMVFLVPDLEEYSGGVRGFLYDFRETAPGPLVADTEAVADQLRRLDELVAEHADAYDTFNATYNRWQDGHSADRVVDAFFRD